MTIPSQKEEKPLANQNLFSQRCFACSIDTPPMDAEGIKDLIEELEAGWKVVDNKKIEKKAFRFKDFKGALEFVNLVGEVAEEEGHHPDIQLAWGMVHISLMTHKIKGLSKKNDFILASKIDQIPKEKKRL